MKKRSHWPPRRDSRITAQYIPDTGDILIGVARGITGAGEVMYRLTPETLAGAIEDRKELAVIVNNLGLLVLSQLSGFNLADSLDDLPRALAKWAHMEKEFDETQREAQIAEALAIAQKTVHGTHGVESTPGDGPDEEDCPCRGTSDQTICAGVGCGFCRAAEDQQPGKFKNGVGQYHEESDEGSDSRADAGPDERTPGESGRDGAQPDNDGAGAGHEVATDELSA